MKRSSSFRKKVAIAIDPQLRKSEGLSALNQLIIAVIALSVLSGVLETEPSLRKQYADVFTGLHAAFFAIFLIEYVARLYASTVNPKYPSVLSYAKTLASVSDLIVLVSFALPFFGFELSILRMFRAARLIRLARIGRYSTAMQSIYDAVISRRYELTVSAIIAGCLMLLSATVLYLFEKDIQPEAFGSIPRSLWWSIVTLTTVGYGDVVPVTTAGRIAAALTSLTGIGIIAIPTGILASAFSDALQKARSKLDDDQR